MNNKPTQTKPAKSPTKPSPTKATSRASTAAKGAVIAGSAAFVASKVVDVALVGSGVAAAVGSVAFAGYMIAQSNNTTPRVNGMQYLAIFAQPHGVKPSAPSTAEPAPAESADAEPSPGVDMTPIGAITPPLPAGPGDYELVGARGDHAWVKVGARIFAVRAGDELPRLGKVAAIVWRGDHWTLEGDGGATLLQTPVAAANPKSVFAKPMIFGGQQ